MSDARTYQCPVCGAFAQASQRTCRHCSTLLATLRCAHCFELNFPDDLHCRGCGFELGLAPHAQSSAQHCPDCKQPLQAFESGPGELYACEQCGGQMVTHGLLRALLEQRAVLGRAVPSPDQAPRGNPLAEPVRYRPCPHCRQLMNRKNFGGASGIIVDVCAVHGTYFDAGELPRVLEFVRRGGLAKAHAVLAKSTPKPPLGALVHPLPSASSSSLLEDCVDLVSFIVDVLRHH